MKKASKNRNLKGVIPSTAKSTNKAKEASKWWNLNSWSNLSMVSLKTINNKKKYSQITSTNMTIFFLCIIPNTDTGIEDYILGRSIRICKSTSNFWWPKKSLKLKTLKVLSTFILTRWISWVRGVKMNTKQVDSFRYCHSSMFLVKIKWLSTLGIKALLVMKVLDPNKATEARRYYAKTILSSPTTKMK